MGTSPLLDVKGAAAYLKIRPGTLRNWLSRKQLGYVKVGRLTRITQDELDRYIAAQTVTAVHVTTPCLKAIPRRSRL